MDLVTSVFGSRYDASDTQPAGQPEAYTSALRVAWGRRRAAALSCVLGRAIRLTAAMIAVTAIMLPVVGVLATSRDAVFGAVVVGNALWCVLAWWLRVRPALPFPALVSVADPGGWQDVDAVTANDRIRAQRSVHRALARLLIVCAIWTVAVLAVGRIIPL